MFAEAGKDVCEDPNPFLSWPMCEWTKNGREWMRSGDFAETTRQVVCSSWSQKMASPLIQTPFPRFLRSFYQGLICKALLEEGGPTRAFVFDPYGSRNLCAAGVWKHMWVSSWRRSFRVYHLSEGLATPSLLGPPAPFLIFLRAPNY